MPHRKSAFRYEVAFVYALDMNRFSLNSAFNLIGARARARNGVEGERGSDRIVFKVGDEKKIRDALLTNFIRERDEPRSRIHLSGIVTILQGGESI